MGRKKILLIDDNPDFQFTMGVFLDRNGFDVVSANGLDSGWETLKTENPDLVLVDVMMDTTFSGFEVCKRIRTTPEYKHLPIIGISGMADELGVKYNENTDSEYFSPDEFFDKPVDKELLLGKIKEYLQLN